MHSPKYNKVKRYYDESLWTAKQVADAVVKGWITADEYEEITGEVFGGLNR